MAFVSFVNQNKLFETFLCQLTYWQQRWLMITSVTVSASHARVTIFLQKVSVCLFAGQVTHQCYYIHPPL